MRWNDSLAPLALDPNMSTQTEHGAPFPRLLLQPVSVPAPSSSKPLPIHESRRRGLARANTVRLHRYAIMCSAAKCPILLSRYEDFTTIGMLRHDTLNPPSINKLAGVVRLDPGCKLGEKPENKKSAQGQYSATRAQRRGDPTMVHGASEEGSGLGSQLVCSEPSW